MTSVSQSEESALDTSRLSAAGISVLAAAAAVATSTSYILQPELSIVARDLGISVSVVGLVTALPIVGYLLGLALLVPLADRVRSNRLIRAQLAVLAIGLLVSASARSPLILGLGLFVSGLCASTGAQMSSLAGRYSPPSRQGRAVGTVTAGISIGIVLPRRFGPGRCRSRCPRLPYRPHVPVAMAGCICRQDCSSARRCWRTVRTRTGQVPK